MCRWCDMDGGKHWTMCVDHPGNVAWRHANPGAEEVAELRQRLAASEAESLEQARLLGMSASREMALLGRLEAANRALVKYGTHVELFQTCEIVMGQEHCTCGLKAAIEAARKL